MTEEEYDKMLLIKILYQRMNWSFSKISRFVSESDKTVKVIYLKSLELPEDELFRDKSVGGEVSLMYVGGTNEVEYADADTNHRVTGGGRRAKQSRSEDG